MADQRAPEGHRHRVPGVGVLGTTVQQDQLRRSLSPHEGAEAPAGAHLHRCSADGGRAVVREAELLRVLVEQPELVVGHAITHRRSLP